MRRDELSIVLINKTDSFVFAPMLIECLHEKGIEADVITPLSEIIRPGTAELIVDEVVNIDDNKQQVTSTQQTISYDYLILATGANANFFGIRGAEDYSFPLKTIADVQRISQQLEVSPAKLRTISVIGAGPTGLELSATLKKHYPQHTIQLIEAQGRLLPTMADALGIMATKILEQNGVRLHTNALITAVTPSSIELSSGMILDSDLTLWTAGISPNVPDIIPLVPKNKPGQLEVDDFLRVIGRERIFAIGDATYRSNPGNSIPTTAQAAVQASSYVATNILASIRMSPLRPFSYHSKGIMIPLGPWNGAGQIAGRFVHGPTIWIGWKLVFVIRFPLRSQRLRLLLRWVL
jgi:NADH dehydrogenase FAD-containing subunit